MNSNAASQASIKSRFLLVPLAAAAMLLAGFASPAAAGPPVGKDGKIRVCYRVKGKPKGDMRVLLGKRKGCRNGERKMIWSAVSASNQSQGSSGQAGPAGAGSQGAAGEDGSSGSNEAVLKTQVATLSLQVEALEKTLQGVTNGDLTGALSTLQGLSNEDLLGAVEAVPVLTSACTTLTDQSNELGDGFEGLIGVLTGVPLIGDIFDGVGVPDALDPLAVCPEPEA